MKTTSITSKIVYGWEEIEPCIMAAMALKRNIFLVGKHGTAKSTLARLLAQSVDSTGSGYRYFAADKAGMINIGGFPDMDKSSKTGEYCFIKTTKSIFGGKVVVIDELPRADKERQNYWLEVLEEGTFQGIPINYEMAIATGNDLTYSGNFKMDLALKSRFLFWLPVPSFETIESNAVMEMIALNVENRSELNYAAKELRILIDDVRKHIEKFKKNKNLINQISTFIGTFTQFVKDKIAADEKLAKEPDAYISPREFANQMYYGMLGLGAYFTVKGFSNPFQHAGKYVVKYTIETRHAAAGVGIVNACNLAWKQLANMLMDGIDTPEGQLKWKFASAISASQKVEFWKQHLADTCKTLNGSDITVMAGDTVQQVLREQNGQIGPLWHIMKSDDKTAHVASEIEGFMITELARKLLYGKANPSSPCGRIYEKYKETEVLQPDYVTEILDAGV